MNPQSLPSGPLSATAERARVLTFLIADVRGYTRFTLEHGDEAAACLAMRFADLVEGAVTRHDGRVVELRGDEALAVFESARDALRAALDLNLRLESEPLYEVEGKPALGIGIGVGVDAGEAVAVAGGYRGAALNLAARLCGLAGSGEVLVSDTVTNLARKVEGIEYVRRGAAQLKGFIEPVTVFRAQAKHDDQAEPDPRGLREREDNLSHGLDGQIQSARDLPIAGFLGSLPGGVLAGRSRELERLLQLVDEVEKGSGRLIMLAGEPGAGKTRLAQEVTLHLRDRGFLIAGGSCSETRETSPFSPFVDVLARLFSLCPPDIREATAAQWPALARIIPGLGSAEHDRVSEPVDQDRLFWSIAAFVEALAERQPVALMIDDLHWADSSSLELIQYLARRTRDDRVLLLSTYRDVEVRRAHPLESALRELNRQDLLQRVPVRRLDPDGTRDLVGVILNDDRVSDELAGFLFERTEGNPLFIQQVLRVLVDRGDVYHADGRWDGKDLLGVDVPESIRSVIGQRLSRLDDETQEALRWASIFGQSFEFDDLAALLESDEDVVERMMQGASAVGLVDSLDGETYRFDHSLTQQTLYAEIPGRRRRRMHVAAAVAVERSGGQRPRAATISRHYLEGEDQANALKFVLMAGDQAAAVAAPSDAQAHYRVAVELARESGDKNRLALSLEKLGGIYLQTIQYPKALACLDEASDVYREVGEPEGRARSKVRSATALALGQRAEEAVTLIDRLVPGLQAAGFTSIIASAYAVQARAFLSLSRFEEELAVAEKAEKLARETGDRTTLASALVDHATALGELGDARAAMPIMEEAIALAEAEADDIILFRALNNAGLTVLPALGMAATREYHERALAVAERSASPCDIAFARVVMGGYAWLAGEWTEALNRFESAAGIARQLGVSQAGWTMALPAWIRVLRGREDQATRELEECIAWAEDHSDRHLLLHANQRLAQQDILCGRPRKALARVEQVRGTPVTQADMRYGLALVGAEAALDLRDHMKARVFLDELAAVNRKEPWFKVDRLRLEAYWFSRTGEVVAADAGFDEALRMAREIPYPQGEADCLRAWALADDARGDGTAARAHLESAHKIYRDLGAHPMAEATARELLVHRSD